MFEHFSGILHNISIVIHFVKSFFFLFGLVKWFEQFSHSKTSKQETSRNQNLKQKTNRNLKPHIEQQSTKNASLQSSSKKVYEGLNRLADQRWTVSSTKLNMKRKLYELNIKKLNFAQKQQKVKKKLCSNFK